MLDVSLRDERSNLLALAIASGTGIPGSGSGAGLPFIPNRQAGRLWRLSLLAIVSPTPRVSECIPNHLVCIYFDKCGK